VIGFLLDLVNDDLLRLVAAHGGDALQLGDLLCLQLVQLGFLLSELGQLVVVIILPVLKALGLAVQGVLPLVQGFLPLVQMALAALNLVPAFPELPLRLRPLAVTVRLGLQNLFLGLEDLFLLVLFSLADGVVVQAAGQILGAADFLLHIVLPIRVTAEAAAGRGRQGYQNPDDRAQMAFTLLFLRILFHFQTDRQARIQRTRARQKAAKKHPAAERCFHH
jgi:hypothetical protein